MKTIKEVIKTLEKAGITVYKYKESNKIRGYELNTYTHGGVNQIVFLDFRNKGLNPHSVEDFMKVYDDYIENIDIDEEIQMNMQDAGYRAMFSLSDAVTDFNNWKTTLEELFKVSKKSPEQRQFEQVKQKFESLLAEMEETLKLMPRKGDTPSECQRINISNHLGGLDMGINGIELEDFTPNEYSQDFELSYS